MPKAVFTLMTTIIQNIFHQIEYVLFDEVFSMVKLSSFRLERGNVATFRKKKRSERRRYALRILVIVSKEKAMQWPAFAKGMFACPSLTCYGTSYLTLVY